MTLSNKDINDLLGRLLDLGNLSRKSSKEENQVHLTMGYKIFLLLTDEEYKKEKIEENPNIFNELCETIDSYIQVLEETSYLIGKEMGEFRDTQEARLVNQSKRRDIDYHLNELGQFSVFDSIDDPLPKDEIIKKCDQLESMHPRILGIITFLKRVRNHFSNDL